MTASRLRTILATNPDATLRGCEPDGWAEAIALDAQAAAKSAAYLASPVAIESLAANYYWPKWTSPWWHLSLLHELGELGRVSGETARAFAASVSRLLPLFHASEAPAGVNVALDLPCPCSLGIACQLLHGLGLDAPATLPWALPLIMKHQLADGGLTCDEDGFHASPQASSMVGTIAPLEALLRLSSEHAARATVERGARALLGRELRRGCSAEQNAEERLDEADWLQPCFPRFYFYDVLRGLDFITAWALTHKRPLSPDLLAAIAFVVEALAAKSPDGAIRIERRSFEGVGSHVRSEAGVWTRIAAAETFALLERVSAPGRVSPALTRSWSACKARLRVLIG